MQLQAARMASGPPPSAPGRTRWRARICCSAWVFCSSRSDGSLSPNSVLSMYVEGAYLLLGLDLQSFKVWGRSVEAFLVSMLARQGLKSRQSRTLRSYVEQPCSRTSGTLRKAKAGSAGAAVLPAAVRRHLCGAAADTGRRTDATLQTDFPTSCRCSTCRCAHQR